MSHVLSLLSCFGTPRLGRAASRCARRIGSPRWSVMRGYLSNWRPAEAGGVRHLDWKSLDNVRLYAWWKYSGLQVQSLSPKQAFLPKNRVKITLNRSRNLWSESGSLAVALKWIRPHAGSSERVVRRIGPVPTRLRPAWP